jgi:hypothetical protein
MALSGSKSITMNRSVLEWYHMLAATEANDDDTDDVADLRRVLRASFFKVRLVHCPLIKFDAVQLSSHGELCVPNFVLYNFREGRCTTMTWSPIE